jgi:replicative DNA helicase
MNAEQSFAGEPPNNIEAEQSVLGAMLLNRDCIDTVLADLEAKDFYRPGHQIIFDAIRTMHEQGDAVDTVTLHAHLTKSDEINRTGGGGYLHELLTNVPTAANVGYYINLAKEVSIRRSALYYSMRVQQFAYGGEANEVEQFLAEAHREFFGEQRENDQHEDSIGNIVDGLGDALERGSTRVNKVPLPYIELQEVLGGLEPGQLVYIGARTGVGKTVVAMDIAREAAVKHELPVYFATLEMSKDEMGKRVLAADARIDLAKLKDGEGLNDDDWTRYARSSARLAEARLHIDASPNATVGRIKSQILKMARGPMGMPKLVVIDYLQLITPATSNRRNDNRQQEVSAISRGLKLLAKELQVPIVVPCQLNRGVEQRAEKSPQMSDLRESGSLEQDADIVILLSRGDHIGDGEMEVNVAKHRNGPTRKFCVAFQGHYSKATSMARG